MSERRIPEDAFEHYVSLGPGRSYKAVAQRYGVSKRAVTKHAVAQGWAQRLERIEAQAREKSDERLADAIDEMRERHLKTLKAMNARALKALKEYPITSGMDAMRAAEMCIKLERLVMGESTERTASVEEVTKRELTRWLKVEGASGSTGQGGQEEEEPGDGSTDEEEASDAHTRTRP